MPPKRKSTTKPLPATATAPAAAPTMHSSPLLTQASSMLRAASTARPAAASLGLRAAALAAPGLPSYVSPTPPNFEDKYKEKLLARAQAQGYASIEEMMAAYRARRDAEEAEAKQRAIEEEKRAAEADLAAEGVGGTGVLPPHVKPLGDILHLDKIKDESPEFIEQLWIAGHVGKKNIAAVIPKETYVVMHARAKKYPMFVLPVFKGDDAETFLLQHSGHQSFFTSMLAYKTHGAEAPVLFTLTYYTDLMDSKGIVFVHGEGDVNTCSLETQKRLTQGMRNFYVDQEYALVEQMYTAPADFDFDNVLAVVRARMEAKKNQAAVENHTEGTAEAAEATTCGRTHNTCARRDREPVYG
ncbi:ATP11 protein-domain-containing protein [Catenaria anguillulae PL171]|uniref:ATP11 protein-domain-containing protein n=1 Tax=Catenaria anguillulae PL171 TaxID=765915 RepID=A0A1Y2HLE8_9FUNG|nr:ATP11 protein-domain-containing protein [Catenaria anguillulae PL171]